MTTSLYWFRNDLRIADNAGFTQACETDRTLAFYCFESKYFDSGDFGIPKTGPFRAKFLLESLKDLEAELRKLKIPLIVTMGNAEAILPPIVQTFGIDSISLQEEWTRDETKSLAAVRKSLPPDFPINTTYDQFLYHPEDIPYEHVGKIPDVFTGFRKKCESRAEVRPLIAAPNPKKQQWTASEKKEFESFGISFTDADTPSRSGNLPSLEELGLEAPQPDPRSAFPFHGGAQSGLARIEQYFWETRRLSYYKRTRNGLLGTDYSSKFSPWLANGSLSARQIYWAVRRYEREVTKNQDTYWMIFEIIWRDFFKYVSQKHGAAIFALEGIHKNKNTPSGVQRQWRQDPEVFQSWTQGQTSSDFVNANMIELRTTGWMSNRGRQNVASFWSSTLKQDWRLGAAWFEYLLLDYDVHSNWGNWMYNSRVGNDPRQRTFNPSLQADRYDSDGKFRRTWLQTGLFQPQLEL